MAVRKTTTEQDCQRKEANVMKEVKETKEQTEVEKKVGGGRPDSERKEKARREKEVERWLCKGQV